MATDPPMQADAHHLRVLRALLPQQVESILEQPEEVFTAGETIGQQVAGVVVDQCVRDHQVGGRAREPIGQVIVVGVRAVEKPTFLTQQAAGVLADPSCVPTCGAFTADLLDHVEGEADMAPLLVFRHVAIVQPTVAMPGNLMPGSAERMANRRGEFQCPADGEGGQRQASGAEQLQNAPHTCARSVFVHALDAQVRFPHTRRAAR
ncbi:hypothetical protein D3C81_1353520 [compost metagenome]